MTLESHPLHRILHPASVVVAGANNNPAKMGTIQALNVLRNGFRGEVVFLHPSEEQVLGRPCYKDPADLPFVPDLALLVTPAPITVDLVEKLGRRGVRYAVITTGGFRELGADGARGEARLMEAANRHGLRFIGPNCIGILNAWHPVNTTVLPTLDRPGPLSLISQSGTFVAQLPVLLKEQGIRYGTAISVGNSSSIDLVDCLEYLGEDPHTRAIALYIEGLARGQRFLEVAREVTRRKPVVALFAGGTAAGARSGMSHTAHLGGPDALYAGVFEQAGVIRARSVEELFGWAWAAAVMPAPRGDRMAILTHSGGPATCMADEVERQGLRLPELSPALQGRLRQHVPPTASVRNPVDLTFHLDPHDFAQALPALLLESDEVDGLLVHGLMDTGYARPLYRLGQDLLPMDEDTFCSAVQLDIDSLVERVRASGKPLTASTFARDDHAAERQRQLDVPLFHSPHAAVRAMGALARAGKVMARPRPASAPQAATPAQPPLAPGLLDEHSSKELLRQYGAPVPREALVATLDDARHAASSLGWPVVLKGLAAGVAHKTEAGLVHLGLADAAALEAAWQAIEERAPGCPRLVAPMLKGSRELLVGLTRFPGFGLAVTLGLGGLFTEALKDVTFRLAPLTREEALAMPESLHARELFGALRGLPPVDREALADVLLAVSRLALEHPEVAEVDLNPVMVVGGQPWVADALVVVSS